MKSSLKALVVHIETGIADRQCRTLFEDQLARYWAGSPGEPDTTDAIRAFAQAHGWAVVIHGQGSRATFTKL